MEEPGPGMVSVGELMRRCNDAALHLKKNGNSRVAFLLLNCAAAMQQMVLRIDELEHPKSQDPMTLPPQGSVPS